jgi:hypothetical protein
MLLPQPERDQYLSSNGRHVPFAADLIRDRSGDDPDARGRPFHWPEYKAPYIYPAFEPGKPEIVRDWPQFFSISSIPNPSGSSIMIARVSPNAYGPRVIGTFMDFR